MDWGVVPWGLKHMCEYIDSIYKPEGLPMAGFASHRLARFMFGLIFFSFWNVAEV
jgi:hypothetical protein